MVPVVIIGTRIIFTNGKTVNSNVLRHSYTMHEFRSLLRTEPPLTISAKDFSGSWDSNTVLMVFPANELQTLIVLGKKLYCSVSVFILCLA
jgi:hypothetical protein